MQGNRKSITRSFMCQDKDLAAPQESDRTEVQTEKTWGPLTLPVLNMITT